MKTYPFAKFREVPIASIKPEGWLRTWLEKQRSGLTGRLDTSTHPFNTKGWAGAEIRSERGEVWWAYEPIAYWVNGLVTCGYLLDDDGLIKKARNQLDYVLRHPDPDGYLGPAFLKQAPTPKKTYRWPHAVFFRALMAYHLATGDSRIVKAIERHYLSNHCSHNSNRDVCNVEAMAWVYAQTGNRAILRKAIQAYEEYNRHSPNDDTSLKNLLSEKKATEHGVTYHEIGKLGTLLYLVTGKQRYLRASMNAVRKLVRDHMLIDGVPSASEFLSGKDALQSHETCTATDFSWSLGYLLEATGNAKYADMIEKATFNAFPGSVTPDFSALQYFSSPNQVVADGSSNQNLFYRGHGYMAYRPTHSPQCCVGNVNRAMPNYISRMWLRDRKGGIVVALYGPSRLTAAVGETKQAITIVQKTSYPFSEDVIFEIRTSQPVKLPLTLRIPAWCGNAKLLLNGQPLRSSLKPGKFTTIKRTFFDRDRLVLILPMEVRLNRGFCGGVGIERGPLVYALRIRERKKFAGRCGDVCAWDLYPSSPWNYTLRLKGKNPSKQIAVVHHDLHRDPWSGIPTPIELLVPAQRVRDWELIHAKTTTYEEVDLERYRKDDVIELVRHKIKGDFRFTPPLPPPSRIRNRLSRKIETISLVPYGCTNLRMTIFPWHNHS